MATDYEKIRRDNIEEYGMGTRHLEFLGRLYSDKTHFIYELLQNAEDACATKVSFILEPARLIFKHNGTELFNERHIRGICGVAEGTKAEDETKIGKFGIGFKSVYAYTRTPIIHCADEHFRIQNYVRPISEDSVAVPPPWTTHFIFPFDKDAPSTATDAFNDIGERLACLGGQTLLFLRNLKEIEWEIQDGAKGFYQSDSKSHSDHRKVHLQCRSNVKDQPISSFESWLVFEKKFNHAGKTTPYNVEVAFKIEKEKETGKEYIQRLLKSPLVVYFPTAIQTGFGFLIQGPFRTTPARDNIVEKNDLNNDILVQIGELIVQALRAIKQLGLLTLDVLSALPLKQTLERQSSIMYDYGARPALAREEQLFEPITSRVAEVLKTEELLPASPHGFVSGNLALLTKTADLRDLLSESQLNALFKTETRRKWISETITSEPMSQLRSYIIHTIGVNELSPEKFAQHINKEFLAAQPDEWFPQFYKFLSGQWLLWCPASAKNQKAGILRHNKPILRLENNLMVVPFRSDEHPNAFLPPAGETEFPTIKRAIAADQKAKKFLTDLGLTEPDLVDEVIEKVLVKYGSDCKVTSEENIRDVTRIVEASKTDSQKKRNRLIEALRNKCFLSAVNAKTGLNVWQKPCEIYFRSSDLEIYFDGNANAFFLAEGYEQEFEALFSEVGVAKEVRLACRKPDYDGNITLADNHSDHRRGLKSFDPDFQIVGLEHALNHPTIAKSMFIWNKLLIPHTSQLQGETEWSSRKDFTCAVKKSGLSKAGKLVVESSWLPDRTDQWHRPKGYTFAKLPEGFHESETLCRSLQMDFVSVTQLAEESGIPGHILEAIQNLLQTSPQTLEKFLLSTPGAIGTGGKPSFPKRPVTNPERRDQKIRERTSDPSDRIYETRERSVRTSKPDLDAKTWLTNQYSNEDRQVICQMCEQEMPFKNREGNYYFEAVEAIPNLGFENHELCLALCPLCAAKYQEFVKRDKEVVAAFRESIVSVKDTDKVSLNIQQQPNTIRFTETHLFDLKIILKKYQMNLHVNISKDSPADVLGG